MEENNQKGIRRIIRTGLVLIIIIALPALSVHYLKKGVDYRKKALSELKDLGKVGDFKLVNQRNLPVTPEVLKGKITVLQFLPTDAAAAQSAVGRMAKAQQGFSEVDDVLFLTILAADSTINLLDAAATLQIKDDKHWFLAAISEGQRRQLATAVFKMPAPESGVAIIDDKLTVRKLYDINSNPDMGRLIEHIAMIMPKQKRK